MCPKEVACPSLQAIPHNNYPPVFSTNANGIASSFLEFDARGVLTGLKLGRATFSISTKSIIDRGEHRLDLHRPAIAAVIDEESWRSGHVVAHGIIVVLADPAGDG